MRQPNLEIIGQAIKTRRRALGLSAEKAARKAGISTSEWYKIENGWRRPNLESCLKIAAALETSIEELLTSCA